MNACSLGVGSRVTQVAFPFSGAGEELVPGQHPVCRARDFLSGMGRGSGLCCPFSLVASGLWASAPPSLQGEPTALLVQGGVA